ncbi:MAG: hypothetical protein DRI01_00560 [Chloroflexi bacterium]|nr:MAG: hypothetical protein DRI01_00560 [Chloroflexota bacterium]
MELTITIEDVLTSKSKALVAKSPELRDKALRKLAFDLLARIAKRTPVDTGRARAGWLTGMKALARKTGQSPNIRFEGSNVSRKAIAQGEKEGSYKETDSAGKKVIEITNSVRYVIYLEYGWSKKSPRGMVRVTISEFKGISKNQFRRDFIREVWRFWSTYHASRIVKRLR